ncbi:MAG: trigger factor [Desulfobulbaceae bacterium]|nr:trigger factor [Desulfobulbaceae bacterium]
MQVTFEEAGAHTKRLKVVLPAATVKKEMEKAYGKLNSEVSLKGFRKGKVPRQVLEKNYLTRIKYEVGEKLIQDTYFDALAETKIDAVTHPEISSQLFADDGAFIYEVEVAVRPYFTLGEYKGLEIEHDGGVATEEEIGKALDSLRREMAPLRSVEERGIQLGDVALIDFQGYHDGKLMPQVKAENYSVDIGSGRFGEEFEKCVMGMKATEKTTREIDFPADFPNPLLAGKKIEFKIEIKDIKERVLPELDDEFAKDSGKEFTTLDELKKAIADKITKEKQEAGAGALADKIMMQLLSRHDFEVPARLVAYEVNSLIKEMEDRLLAQKLTLESAGVKREELVEQYRDVATKRVKGDFILKKIAEVEEIKLVDTDIEQGFLRISRQYNMQLDEVRKYFASRDDLLPFMNELLSEKIINFLREQAVIKTVVASKDAATEPVAAEEK